MLFSQVDAMQLGGWMFTGACFLGMVKLALDLWKGHFKESPPPGETYSRKTDCLVKHSAIDARVATLEARRDRDQELASASRKGIYEQIGAIKEEMKRMEIRINKADEERTSFIHERVNEVLHAVGRLEGRIESKL